MCGIIGYIGKNKALPILIDGLKKLEYRGYDSSGIALQSNNNITLIKSKGKIKKLEQKIFDNITKEENGKENQWQSTVGIAHTRWATHGKPNEENAHPHRDCTKKIFVVHNGIIENYQELKDHLTSKNHTFTSETDTEVIAHLIEDFYKEIKELNNNQRLKTALEKTLQLIKGAYGLAVIHSDEPNKILATRHSSPLVIGIGDNETIIASDIAGIVSHTKKVIYLNDKEIAEITNESSDPTKTKISTKIFNLKNEEVKQNIEEIEWDIENVQKQGFEDFMLKEIFEQPEAIINTMRGRTMDNDDVKLGGLDNVIDRLKGIEKIIFVGCGTAKNAALIGEYMIEEYAGIPVDVDDASEFRYREQPIDKKTCIIAISQSGETADTLAAIRKAKNLKEDVLTLSIVNVVGSTMTRITDAGMYNHIGPEISVASTKAFISQITILALLTIFLGKQRAMTQNTAKEIVQELKQIPQKIKKILELNKDIKKIAKKYYKADNFAFLGRKYNSSIAFEGALKLKEISYIHAEGFLAGEPKHGPIAMIDKDFPSIFIAPKDSVYEKILSNMEEFKSRDGKIIAIAQTGDKKIQNTANDIIYIPQTLEMLSPILSIIPLQLFAYHVAVLRGLNVDQPRNLAKSVTVE